MSSGFETYLQQKLVNEIVGITPGVQVQVHTGGRKVGDVQVGETYAYYDLSSLTKIIFTVQAMTFLFEQGKWNLDTTVSSVLKWFPHKDVKIADILTHSSGLDWWLPFYQKVDLSLPADKKWLELKNFLAQQELRPSDVSVYSDVGFWVLGFVLEELYQKPLLDIWTGLKESIYTGSTLEFHINNQPQENLRLYAPTERCPWRRKLLQGEVHDENAWSLGGVAPHAGLFGSIDDVSWFTLYLRAQMKGISNIKLRPKTIKLFTTRARYKGQGDWTLGYMLPTFGKASCGTYFSPDSVGHTGFTGTSAWYDPHSDLSVTILSNRLFYGRENSKFKDLRPKIHNWVVEGLKKI